MTRHRNPLLRHAAILMVVLLLNSEFVFGSWLSEITGVDINVPAGTISFSNPRPDAIPEMLKNLPLDVLEFATNCLLTKGVCPGAWMATLVRQAKAQAQNGSQPISDDIRSRLVNFFPGYILDKARWNLADPNRSALERMIFGGGCPDVQILGLYVSCSNGALTLDNVIVFRSIEYEQNYVRWAHELTHVSQYDGMGIDGFAFAYTLDPGSLEGQAYAWENTVANAPQTYQPNYQPTQQYWTMSSVRRVPLTANDFAVGVSRVSSDPVWRQTHSGWGRGQDCTYMRGPGTDTGIAVQASDQHLNAGRSYERVQNWAGAIGEYREAVRLNPISAIAFDRLGVVLTKNGQPQQGIPQIKRAICMDSSKPDFRGDLASAYATSGSFDAAIVEYQIALWFNPRNVQYHRDLGAALERKSDGEGAKMQYWAATLLQPGSSNGPRSMPPPLRVGPSALALPAWLRPIRWESETQTQWYATVAGRGCRIDVSKQVLFDPKPDRSSLLIYTEDTLLSDDASDFCIDHSDDPGVEKHIYMRFGITLAPKQDGTISLNGALEDPCDQCVVPQNFPSPAISGMIIGRTNQEFWLSVNGAVNGGFQMTPIQ